jgi:GNAT superfamily N-acetyltransferase
MDLRLFRNGDKAFGIHGPAQDAAHWRRTVVAEERGLALGLDSILLSSTHRHRYLVEIEVEPSSRGRGIGRALFDQLLEVRAEPYPLMARAMTSRPERLAFATALGFQVLMTCPSPQVEPAAAAVRDWCDLQPAPTASVWYRSVR